MITGVENHEDLTSIIKHAIGDEHYQTKLMNNHILGSLMNTSRIDIKVTMKKLHHSYQPISMLSSLNDQGLQALNATQN
jgi:hypothetical protein